MTGAASPAAPHHASEARGPRAARPTAAADMNSFDEILRAFWSRPAYQRIFLAFTVGLFLSCAARVSQAQPEPAAHEAIVAR